MVATLKVEGLFVYPVKSMRGTSLDEVLVDAIGLEGDRQFGVYDVTSSTVITANARDVSLKQWPRSLTTGSA